MINPFNASSFRIPTVPEEILIDGLDTKKSSLGPLSFLIYINDFRLCLDQCESGHFADDTFIMFPSKKLSTIESIVNNELKLVSWLRLNI